jgi:hypothetical protein
MTTDAAPETVDHPKHYNSHPSGVECAMVCRLCSWNFGSAIKYIWRYRDKNGNEDLRMARWHLKDIKSSGEAHHLPHKAKTLLQRVNNHDRDQLRREIFGYLVLGQVDQAIETITTFVEGRQAGRRGRR